MIMSMEEMDCNRETRFKESNPALSGSLDKYQHCSKKVPEGLLNQLHVLIEDQRLYLKPQLSLDNLAQKLNVHRNTLSMVVNFCYGMNFSDFINTFRISEAKRIIDQLQRKRMFVKIWRVCIEAGFNSVSTFYRVFKRFTGCTPLEYKSKVERTGSESTTEELFQHYFRNRNAQ